LHLPHDIHLSSLIVNVFELSHRFLLDALTRKIEAMICGEDMITADNVCSLLMLSETYQSLFLREECFDFLLVHFDSVPHEDFIALTEEQQHELERSLTFRAHNGRSPTLVDAKKEVLKRRADAREKRHQSHAL
jgi:hypothetical protein